MPVNAAYELVTSQIKKDHREQLNKKDQEIARLTQVNSELVASAILANERADVPVDEHETRSSAESNSVIWIWRLLL